MTIVASDTLIAGSTESITAYSASWTLLENAINVSTTGALGNSSAVNCEAYWNANAFGNDQSSQVVIASLGSSTGSYAGVAVRMSSSGGVNEYFFRVAGSSGHTYQVGKIVGGTFTNLSGTLSHTFAVNDVLTLIAAGTTISAFQNGTLLYSTTDNSLSGASSAAGLAFYSTNGPVVKNWIGATPYTLSAAQGSFALTGEAAEQDEMLGAVQGSFALTGKAVTALRQMFAPQGAFALTGFNAALSWSGLGRSRVPIPNSYYRFIPFQLACRLRYLQRGTLNVGNTQQNIANLLAAARAEAANPSNPNWAKYSLAPSGKYILTIAPGYVPGFVKPPAL